MSAWYWRVVVLKTVFVLFYYVSYLHADEAANKLPFCNPHTLNHGSSKDDLVIVSTLDGKLTAFSTENGIKVWDLETQPLLSSNLHHVELTSGGKWMRLVPSLRGTLYSLTGDTLEPLPFDTDQLLSASFKYSDDLVIAGARESQWIGLDAQTGSVQYECGTSGCNGDQQAGSGKLLVLRRHSSTVRALHPRTGSEKWNFSVAEHQLALSQSDCAGPDSPASVSVAVALPEGIVAVKKPGDRLPVWQQQLESPVADMWRLHGGSLQHIDVLFEATRSLVNNEVEASPPSLYIGVHDRMLYVQEGMLYSQKLEPSVPVKLPWKLMNARPLIGHDGETALTLQEADSNALSLITLYGNAGYTGNHGYFLYLQETCDQAIQTTEETIDYTTNYSEDTHHHVHVHVYSLWFWWKEVLLIAISSALLMNLMIWPRFFAPKFRAVTPLPTVNQECIVVERHYDRQSEYSGRYDNDFTLIRCLGKGGFGVVFEARNNIDHCSYAVKRITLPRKLSRRERVMREVRALAQLEHDNIVRYYNAWVEEPPTDWQRKRDAVWMRELEDASSFPVDEYTATSPKSRPSDVPRKSIKNNGDVLNLYRNVDDCIDALDFDKRLGELSKRNRSLSCNDSFSIVFDDNASKDPSKNTLATQTPNTLSKDLSKCLTKASGDNDSFIVFANTDDGKLSEARQVQETINESIDKRLEKVKECDVFSQDSCKKKKKKGHTRHWSLDMCVTEPPPPNMYLYIQMQLCLRDSLHDWLRQNDTWEVRKDRVKTLFSQIVSAVEYVHLAGLIHRDLKPNNIFFSRDGKVKVGDFGLVTAMNETSQDGDTPVIGNGHVRHTDRVGTRLYMSPEQLTGRYNYKVDIYSLGIILYELLQPFGTESERVACLMKLRGGHMPQRFKEKYPEESEVLKLMLSENPMERPTASGVKARAPLYEETDHTWHFTLPNHSG